MIGQAVECDRWMDSILSACVNIPCCWPDFHLSSLRLNTKSFGDGAGSSHFPRANVVAPLEDREWKRRWHSLSEDLEFIVSGIKWLPTGSHFQESGDKLWRENDFCSEVT